MTNTTQRVPAFFGLTDQEQTPKLYIFYRVRKLHFAHIIYQIIFQPQKKTVKIPYDIREYKKSQDDSIYR